jgi:hypothetical protein
MVRCNAAAIGSHSAAQRGRRRRWSQRPSAPSVATGETPVQIEAFLKVSQWIRFEGETQEQVFRWIKQPLCLRQYSKQSGQARGFLRRYLAKMTGLSRAQVTRLIRRNRESGAVQPVRYRRHRFPQRYTCADIELLVGVDEALDLARAGHETHF